ncbi:MAG: LLM class flavin-dependent oxidoreductase [Gammaproteobacteria bacterium]|nr:LLM class flavin-dependent oxidoreductase [Gammaproteobacteria bacterium]
MQIDIALEPEYSAGELAELAALAERNGIATIWVTNDTLARDLFMLFSKVADATRSIRLGVMAISPFEIHPVKLASALSTLNEMSNGRASLVVGAGGAIRAHARLDFSRQVRAVKECVEILKSAGADHTLNFAGELYPVWNFRLPWAIETPPRVLVGANREQMLRMSAHKSDGVHLSDIPLQLIPQTVATVKGALATHNRTAEGFEFNNFWAFHVKADRAAAELEARSRLVLRGMLDPLWIEPFLSDAEVKQVRGNMPSFWTQLQKRDGVIENVPEPLVDKLIENLTLTASTKELDGRLEVLHKFADEGLTHITLGLHDDAASTIRLIGERVVPQFAKT